MKLTIKTHICRYTCNCCTYIYCIYCYIYVCVCVCRIHIDMHTTEMWIFMYMYISRSGHKLKFVCKGANHLLLFWVRTLRLGGCDWWHQSGTLHVQMVFGQSLQWLRPLVTWCSGDIFLPVDHGRREGKCGAGKTLV